MGVLGACLALGVSLFLSKEYSSSVRVLITQINATGLDPYTAIKSTERIAENLNEIMYTTSFFNNVMAQVQGFDPSYFPVDEYQKRKLWKETVSASVAPGTGIMTVTAYHPTRASARVLVEAAAREMSIQAPNYFGSSVRAQVIDSPLDSRWYARPNFVSNVGFGFLLGFFVGLGWVLYRQLRKG